MLRSVTNPAVLVVAIALVILVHPVLAKQKKDKGPGMSQAATIAAPIYAADVDQRILFPRRNTDEYDLIFALMGVDISLKYNDRLCKEGYGIIQTSSKWYVNQLKSSPDTLSDIMRWQFGSFQQTYCQFEGDRRYSMEVYYLGDRVGDAVINIIGDVPFGTFNISANIYGSVTKDPPSDLHIVQEVMDRWWEENASGRGLGPSQRSGQAEVLSLATRNPEAAFISYLFENGNTLLVDEWYADPVESASKFDFLRLAADLGSRSAAAYYTEALEKLSSTQNDPSAAMLIACYAAKASIFPSTLTHSFEQYKTPAANGYVRDNGGELADCTAYGRSAQGGADCPASAAETTPGIIHIAENGARFLLKNYCSTGSAWERLVEAENYQASLGLALTSLNLVDNRCQVSAAGIAELDIRFKLDQMQCGPARNGTATCTAVSSMLCGPRGGDLRQNGWGDVGMYCTAATGFENLMSFPAQLSVAFDPTNCNWETISMNIFGSAIP
jgi:hypothetical protein